MNWYESKQKLDKMIKEKETKKLNDISQNINASITDEEALECIKACIEETKFVDGI